MQVVTKSGHVRFEHHDEFRGDVTITKGDSSVTVPIDALRHFVGEQIRFHRLEETRSMKISDLLKKMV